jgi:hypothetical protein
MPGGHAGVSMTVHLAAADPVAARSQKGLSLAWHIILSLAWHIILARFGVGLPGLRVLKVAAAVNPEPGIQYGFWAVVPVYGVLTVVTISVLRHMTRSVPVPAAPQEADVTSYRVV